MKSKGIVSWIFPLLATGVIAVGRVYDERLFYFGMNISLIISSCFIIYSLLFLASIKNVRLFPTKRIFYLFLSILIVSPLFWGFYNVTEYGLYKYINFIFLIVPLLIVLSEKFSYSDVLRLFQVLFWFITFLSIAGLSIVSTTSGRLSAFGGGPIVFSRWMLIGVTILLFLKLFKSNKIKWIFIFLFFILSLASGSRGPVFAFLFTISVYLLLNFQRVIVKLIGGVVLVLTVFLLVGNELNFNDFGKADRLATKDSTSKNVRLKFAKRSLDLIVAYPFGVGIGNWQEYCNKTKPYHLLKHQYPHNLVLEVFAELGLIGGVLLLLVILKSLYLTYFRMTTIPNANGIYSLLFYLQIFLFINSCFSGNLNDARFLFVVIAISLTKEPLIKENNA
jgi:O-antigen ligase